MPADILHDSRITRIVELALMEDIGLGDVTSEAILADSQHGHGEFLCKAEGVSAGLDVAALVFEHCDSGIQFRPVVLDGATVRPGQVLATVQGKAIGILQGERTALNFLQRMSGIATITRKFVDAVSGTNVKITDTRKTAPGLRVLDKLAVRCGGGVNHRFGLDDMMLIKDNHIVASGSISNAVKLCRSYRESKDTAIPIEVETKNLPEVQEALECGGIARIMLDNFTPAEMVRAVKLIAHRVEVEASGGITLENVRTYAETGVDFISIGALTHSSKALDISLELLHV